MKPPDRPPRSRGSPSGRGLARGVWLAAALAAAAATPGCPRSTGPVPAASGDDAPAGACWMVLDVREAGTGNPLAAVVWSREHPEDFETLVPTAEGTTGRFEGVGRKPGGGYHVPFAPGERVSLRVWSLGHELEEIEMHLRRGENLVVVTLRPAEVDDHRIPERIRTEAFDVPSEGPRSGS